MRKYQLVLQFRALSLQDFDRLIRFETTLLNTLLPSLAKVDGHDCGNGEFNLLIHTDNPQGAFEAAEVLRQREFVEYAPVAAYRESLVDNDLVLSPVGYEGFTIS